MYKKIKLSASLMCVDWLNLKNQILDLENNDIDYIHYDIVETTLLTLQWGQQL